VCAGVLFVCTLVCMCVRVSMHGRATVQSYGYARHTRVRLNACVPASSCTHARQLGHMLMQLASFTHDKAHTWHHSHMTQHTHGITHTCHYSHMTQHTFTLRSRIMVSTPDLTHRPQRHAQPIHSRTSEQHTPRVDQNPKHTVYIRYFWQGNHQ
jgi:hypothetical protein